MQDVRADGGHVSILPNCLWGKMTQKKLYMGIEASEKEGTSGGLGSQSLGNCRTDQERSGISFLFVA